MAAGGGGGGRASSSAASSSAGALEASLDRKLQAVTNTMESIQGLSSWCLENKRHHSTIVYHWMKWLRRCECGRRSGRAAPFPSRLSVSVRAGAGPGAPCWAARVDEGSSRETERFPLLEGLLSSPTLWKLRLGFVFCAPKAFPAVLLGWSVSGRGVLRKGRLHGSLGCVLPKLRVGSGAQRSARSPAVEL